MREGRTLQEVAVELQRQRAATRDFKAPTKKLQYETDGSVTVNRADGWVFNPTTLFNRQVASYTGIPQKYFDRCAAEDKNLLAHNVNTWFAKSDETRLVRTLDGTARAFLSHRYRIIDNIDVVETTLPIFAEHGVTTVSQEVTDSRLYIKAVNTRKTVEVKKGDPVQFGVVISNSEVGLGAVHVDPLIYRLVCLNGAILADSGLRKFHIGRRLQELDESQEVFKDDTMVADNKAFFLKLRDVVTAAFDETAMTDVLEAAEAGTKRLLGQGRFLEEVVEVTAKKYGLNETEGQGVLRHLIDGRDLTQWGLANAVTAFSQQADSYERATELERVGGTLLTLSETEWKELA